MYSQECPVIACDTVFHETTHQLKGPCEFGRFLCRVAEDPRGCTNYKRSAKFEVMAEVQMGIQMDERIEEVFEF